MVPLGVTLYLLLVSAGSGGEVKVDIENHQRVLESTKEQEIKERPNTKEQEEDGRRSSRELEYFERPTTLQRMLEEASCHFGWCPFSVNLQSVNLCLENSKQKSHW